MGVYFDEVPLKQYYPTILTIEQVYGDGTVGRVDLTPWYCEQVAAKILNRQRSITLDGSVEAVRWNASNNAA